MDLPGNTESDQIANDQRGATTHSQQLDYEIAPATLRTLLRQHEDTRVHLSLVTDEHLLSRFLICGIKHSNLQQRRQVPREWQCLFARWRMGIVDSCGSYPRHMGFVPKNLPCRFCHAAKESPVHLLEFCPGTLLYRIQHDLSRKTLQDDTASNIVKIVQFDAWISRSLPFAIFPQIQKTLLASLKRHLEHGATSGEQTAPSNRPPDPKRSCQRLNRKRPLVIKSSTWCSKPNKRNEREIA